MPGLPVVACFNVGSILGLVRSDSHTEVFTSVISENVRVDVVTISDVCVVFSNMVRLIPSSKLSSKFTNAIIHCIYCA